MVTNMNTLIIHHTYTFRTEKGAVCGVYQGRLNEVLNHFYRWVKVKNHVLMPLVYVFVLVQS